jgi:hypothetical protein
MNSTIITCSLFIPCGYAHTDHTFLVSSLIYQVRTLTGEYDLVRVFYCTLEGNVNAGVLPINVLHNQDFLSSIALHLAAPLFNAGSSFFSFPLLFTFFYDLKTNIYSLLT